MFNRTASSDSPLAFLGLQLDPLFPVHLRDESARSGCFIGGANGISPGKSGRSSRQSYSRIFPLAPHYRFDVVAP